MPGSVANASPSAVMPLALARQFSEQRELPVRVNEYRDGTLHRTREASTSRRRFTATVRLDATNLIALQSFWATMRQSAFFYYHLKETPSGGYDPTGVATAGRYTVRLATPWAESMD